MFSRQHQHEWPVWNAADWDDGHATTFRTRFEGSKYELRVRWHRKLNSTTQSFISIVRISLALFENNEWKEIHAVYEYPDGKVDITIQDIKDRLPEFAILHLL